MLFDESYLIRGKDFKVDENLIIRNPTIDEILDFKESNYFSLISSFIADPFDYKVQLWDTGIDFEILDGFEFFYSMIRNIGPDMSSILFSDLDFTKFEMYINTSNGDKFISDGTVIIDRLAKDVITDFIRKINHIPIKEPEIYLNKYIKERQLKLARDRQKAEERRRKEDNNSLNKSELVGYISALVNCAECSYNYNTIMDLHISQFYDCLKRIQKIKNANELTIGYYSGTAAACAFGGQSMFSGNGIKQENLNWLS